MFRNAFRVVLLASILFTAACADAPTAPEQTPEQELTLAQAQADLHWGQGCPTIGPLSVLAIAIMSHNNEDRRFVVARLGELSDDIRARRQARIRDRAHALVDFLLKRYQAGKFRGTDAQFAALINAIYCFAGIDIDINTPKNTELILPSDQPQVVLVNNGSAGVQLPANPVTEPTLLTVEQLPDTFTNNEYLQTKLDQYPGFILVTKSSETNAPLAKPVVVAVCADGVIPSDVRNRLRLGHGRASGFEIAAPGDAGFLTCPNRVAEARPASGWARVAELLMPAKAHAFQQEFGGGVGGTVTEFSPFAPVDPQLEFGGGVGGTVTEFTQTGTMRAALLSDELVLAGACPATIEGAEGSPVRESCRPYIRVTTRLGTPFIGVPVSWDVTAGGGNVAGNTGTCGAFGSTAATVTGPNGGAGICWTLGTVGANQVVATPSLGGDAVAGVTFIPASKTFDAIANPPAGLAFSLQPPPFVRAGVGFPAEVTVVDKNGERVYASTDSVVLVRLNTGSFINGIQQAKAKAVAGIATFPALPVTLVGTYQLVANSEFIPPVDPIMSSPFSVTSGFGWTLAKDAGDAQSGVAGQPAPVDPTVLVTDRYGNPAVGSVITWKRIAGGFATTIGQSTTDASGRASIPWTLVLGANELRAGLNEGSFATISFTATGNAP